MTTPSTLGSIVSSLRDRLSDANDDALRSHKAAMNSYGAGYDRGFADAIKEILNEITGDYADAGDQSLNAQEKS